MSLRLRVILLVVLSILPLLIFSLVSQYMAYKSHVDETGKQSMILTRSMCQIIDQKLENYISALQILSLSTALQTGDLVAFRERAEAVVTQQFPGSNIILLRQDGQQLVNTILAPGAALPIRPNLVTTHQVFATGRPAISDFYMGAVGPRPVVSIDVPVTAADGSVAYVLSINPRLDDFNDAMGKKLLPESWVASVSDRHGVIIARTRAQETYVGHSVSSRLLARLMVDQFGTLETTTLDGVPSLSSFSHAEKFGWAVAVAVPRAEMIAPAVTSAAETLAVGVLLLVMGLVTSLHVARQVTRPMAQLRHLALSIDKGELAQPQPTGLPEADVVMQALLTAAQTRQRSEDEGSRALAALRESEEKLRQSQKMEAVGQLTGGLAHDFNNLLLVIIGNIELLLEQTPATSETAELARDAQEAAQRGAELTRSLLAFARRQPLHPRRTDLNDLVTRMTRLLSRTLGAQIEISLDLPLDVWPILVDPAQLEAAVTNLATNARDAMPKGGRLVIATANCRFDEDRSAIYHDVAPGEYAMLQVSDTGSGMTPDVLNQIFEPFFTTKGGQGTGLGLSMVFGFLKQSGGHINAYSEPGLGTIFRLYLPRDGDVDAERKAVLEDGVIARGEGETILIVEDLEPLRRLVTRQVSELGYRVRDAADASAALDIIASETVDLIFSDVVMGGKIDGLELARVVNAERPEIKIVLTSGFPAGANVGGRQSRLDGFTLLSKPYRNADLARVLREALDVGDEKVG